MPRVATATYTGCLDHAPASTMNSPMKFEIPGRDIVAKPAKRNIPASTGAVFCTPPKASTWADPRRFTRNPSTRNSAAVEKPWLNM